MSLEGVNIKLVNFEHTMEVAYSLRGLLQLDNQFKRKSQEYCRKKSREMVPRKSWVSDSLPISKSHKPNDIESPVIGFILGVVVYYN